MVRIAMMLLSFLIVVAVDLCSTRCYLLCCIFHSVDNPPSTNHETRLGSESPSSSTLVSSAPSVVNGTTRDLEPSSSSTTYVSVLSTSDGVLQTSSGQASRDLLCQTSSLPTPSDRRLQLNKDLNHLWIRWISVASSRPSKSHAASRSYVDPSNRDLDGISSPTSRNVGETIPPSSSFAD